MLRSTAQWGCMKRIVNNLVYDTASGTLLVEHRRSTSPAIGLDVCETLYLSPRGTYLIHRQYSDGREELDVFSNRDVVYDWAVKSNLVDFVKDHFSDKVEDG